MSEPTRPAMRYLGGKWKLAPWIVQHFPAHRIYVEPFGGAASVLLRKNRCNTEVYNDLDGDVVGLLRVLRDPASAAELVRRVELTPFARAEFDLSYERSDCPIEAARRLLVRSYMGHGSSAYSLQRRTGFRGSNRGALDAPPAVDWANFPPALAQVAERFIGVAIENQPAAKVMARFDGPSTLFYVDPPYVHATRSRKRNAGALQHGYAHELSEDDHQQLLDQLTALQGMVVLSGYPHALYDDRLRGWDRITINTHADGARPRTEALWINPAATAATGLFAAMGAGR